MPKAQSINQNLNPDALPDFRNTGVILRILLLANSAAFMAALIEVSSWQDALGRLVDIFTFLLPVLAACLLLLFMLNTVLGRLPYRHGIAAVIGLSGMVTLAVYWLGGEFYAPLQPDGYFYATRDFLVALAAAALLLFYFRLRASALSPALQASRLQALQARIRPHFLFNSINAVLGIVRSDPKRAEAALEDMSDLFRMAMAQRSDVVPARHEIELAQQYQSLEQLRMGERLQVNWNTELLPDDAMIPPLILQPLLENAVYHGIEPLTEGGLVDVRLFLNAGQIHIEMYNPRPREGAFHAGNKLALANIRERLALQFDIEASYTVESGKDFYRVHIVLPYVKEETP